MKKLPSIIVTGASGIVGRSFLESVRDDYRIYAIARRPQKKAGVPNHPNIHWIQVDIGNSEALQRVTANIRHAGGADYLLHLAAHYDFENTENPAYEHTNVNGTRHVLEQARALEVKHFVFASSVAACSFPVPGAAITEASLPDAEFPYARSKRIGEETVREYSRWFPCSIVRLAAVFSDWCEYAPLYVFLSTWLSSGWRARMIAGRGLSAVPYIHSRDVNRLFLTLLRRGSELPRCGVYLASPDGATTHRDLFELATRYHFERPPGAIMLPRGLARFGVTARDALGRVAGRRPFERPWMLEYLDRQLTIDASHTRDMLGWAPTPRYQILRRILFLLEKMKGNPHEWRKRNERALRRPSGRPALVIHDAMMEAREAIVDEIAAYLQSPVRTERFPNYSRMSTGELTWYTGIIYELLMATVRTGDRTLLLNYVHDLARRRFERSFPPAEVCDALLATSEVTVEELLYKPELSDFRQSVRDWIALSIALAIDGVQDAYDDFRPDPGSAATPGSDPTETDRELEDVVEKLNSFYRAPVESGSPAVALSRSAT